MEHHQQIIAVLEAVRSERGIPKSELARRSEVDPRRLQLILEGKRQLRADELVRVSIVLGMGMKQFVPQEMLERYEEAAKRAAEDCEPKDIPACKSSGMGCQTA